tara:strand:- start:25 stop:339 length:315 start_codon:yes stop_codon:yes gene_type:complete
MPLHNTTIRTATVVYACAELIRMLPESGALHIIVEDDNVEDTHLKMCWDFTHSDLHFDHTAVEQISVELATLAMMFQMSTGQRLDALRLAKLTSTIITPGGIIE